MEPITPTGTEFYSPSGVECEVDSNFDGGRADASPITSAFCEGDGQTAVELEPDGSVDVCGNGQCTGNAGVNTPTLPVGTAMVLQPFTCLSETQGVRCTISNGDGFLMTTSTLTHLGNGPLLNKTSFAP